MNFLSFRKNDLIRKIRLVSKSMTSQSGKQAITIHILVSVSRMKDTMTNETIHAESEVGRLVPGLFFIF